METEMDPETLENFNNLTWLVAREDFIKVGNIFVQNY
jgi:hypothetical protein